jgi:hypothetical protein
VGLNSLKSLNLTNVYPNNYNKNNNKKNNKVKSKPLELRSQVKITNLPVITETETELFTQFVKLVKKPFKIVESQRPNLLTKTDINSVLQLTFFLISTLFKL